MATPQRVTGITGGHVDTEAREISFDLSTPQGTKIPLSAKFAGAQQIVSSLAVMVKKLDAVMRAKGEMAAVSVEQIAEIDVKQERWEGRILIWIRTAEGVPHVFALPAQSASELADRLKTESARSTQPGNA
jgi:hypothetical protein